MTYPFKAGLEYGPRDGTLGLAFHMTEGNGGINDVIYLAKRASETKAQWAKRIRGVSAHVVIIDDGTIWQMVRFDRVAGSFNPNDRGPASGWYNRDVIKAVLGAHYVDPNQWSIVTEIAGKRAKGPTDAQVESAIAWGLAMRKQFPTIRGAFGHHDQTDTKGCPGTTPNMKAIFEGVGGHGLFPAKEAPLQTFNFIDGKTTSGKITVDKPGHAYQRLLDGTLHPIKLGPAWVDRPAIGPVTLAVPIGGGLPGADRSTAYIIGTEAAAILASDGTFTPTTSAPDYGAHDEQKRDEWLAALKEIYP